MAVAGRASAPAAVRRSLMLALAFTAVIYVYVRLASGEAGHHRERWKTYTCFHSSQARSFLNGHTFLPIDVPRELLALPDPYDPLQNSDYRLGDALLYQGKYYMYWGPAPALLLAPFQWARGARLIGDQYLALGFTIGSFVFGSLLLVLIWWRARPAVPWWLVVTGVAAYGLSNPMPFLLSRPAVYEAAIAGAQCFLIGGLLLAALADARPIAGKGSQGRRITGSLWFSCGAFLAGAVGCRLSLAPVVAVLAIMAVWRILRRHRSDKLLSRPRIALCLWLLLPMLAGAAGLGLFNKARFGSFTDFGVQYQLAGVNVHAIYKTYLTSFRYVPANLYSYLLRPVAWSERFPFATARIGLDPASFPSLIPVSSRYIGNEPVAGVLLVNPLLWCLLLPLWGWTQRARHALPGHSAENKVYATAPRWLRFSLLSAGLLGILPALGFIGSTMRYLADAIPALTLLAVIEAWLQIAAAGPAGGRAARRWGQVVLAGLCIVTAIAGVALAESGYYERKAMVIHVDRGRLPALGPDSAHSFSCSGDPVTLTVRCGEDGNVILDTDWFPEGLPDNASSWSVIGPLGTTLQMPRERSHCLMGLPASKGDHEIRFVPASPRTPGSRIDRLRVNMVP